MGVYKNCIEPFLMTINRCLSLEPDPLQYAEFNTLVIPGDFVFTCEFLRVESNNFDTIIGRNSGTSNLTEKIGFNGTTFFFRAATDGPSITANIGYTSTLNNQWNALYVERIGGVVKARLNGGSLVTVGTLDGTCQFTALGYDRNPSNIFVGRLDNVQVSVGGQMAAQWYMQSAYDSSGNERPLNLIGGAKFIER